MSLELWKLHKSDLRNVMVKNLKASRFLCVECVYVRRTYSNVTHTTLVIRKYVYNAGQSIMRPCHLLVGHHYHVTHLNISTSKCILLSLL